jgi:hypothetical protein
MRRHPFLQLCNWGQLYYLELVFCCCPRVLTPVSPPDFLTYALITYVVSFIFWEIST